MDISSGKAEIHQVQIVYNRLDYLIKPVFILAQDPDHQRSIDQVYQYCDSLGDERQHDTFTDLLVHAFALRP